MCTNGVEISENFKNFDFVRLTFCDTMGIPRCKLVPVNRILAFLRSGNLGFCSFGVISDASSNPVYFKKLMEAGDPDFSAAPQLETLHLCEWSGGETGHKVAQIICHLVPKTVCNELTIYDSRCICARLVHELETTFSLQMWSSLEYEFVLATKNRTPVFNGKHIFSSLVGKQMEPFLFTVANRLQSAGVEVETMHSQFGSGQFEITTVPNFGEKAADTAFLLKQCVKETAVELGFEASFMCNPWEDVRSGCHFNFSVWKGQCNIFTNEESSEGLSDEARFWIAGIFEHIDAITALVCPTNNCFNGFVDGGVAPFNICFDVENRDCCIRVKRSPSTGSFMEFRTPSSAANPYIVVAAVIAAGLEGLRRKLEVSLKRQFQTMPAKVLLKKMYEELL